MYVGLMEFATVVWCVQSSGTLTSLNLSWNGVDARTCVALSSALKHSTSLTSLDLSHTKIDSRSVELLVKALRQNTTLTSLKVRLIDVKKTFFHATQFL